MADVLKTSNLIAGYIMDDLMNTSAYCMIANRDVLDPEFENKTYTPGRSVDIRRPNRGHEAGDGLVATARDFTERTETLTIDHLYWQMFDFDIEQLSLDINDDKDAERVYKRYVKPEVNTLINKLDTGISTQSTLQGYLHTGTPGTPINTYGIWADTAALLQYLGVPDDELRGITTNKDAAELKKALYNIFNTQVTDPILMKGFLGELDQFQLNQSQNIVSHVAGYTAGTTAAVNAAVSSGTTIVLKSIPADGTIKAGDKISIAGSKMLNPGNKSATPYDAQYTVQADATVTSGAATITVYPEIDISATSEWRNLDVAIAEDAVVTIKGSYRANNAMHPQALTLAMPQMRKIAVPFCENFTDPETKISLQMVQQGAIGNMNNAFRINLLAGHRWHPDFFAMMLA